MIDCTSEVANANHSEGGWSRGHLSEKYFASAEIDLKFLLFPLNFEGKVE